MGAVFSGKQMHAFFQDPVFWGQGQRFTDLRLRINGRVIDEKDFQANWDVSDIQEDDFVEILSGAWHGQGWTLPHQCMSHVVEYWHAGIHPQAPLQLSSTMQAMAPAPLPLANEAPPPSKAIRRPVFLPSS